MPTLISLRHRLSSSSVLFHLLLAAVCVWVLTLPVFPSQDGPMHRYYVHVLDAVLHHRPQYALYQLRHPPPPYITQYALLLGLFHLFPLDQAERIFVCITLLCFAYGVRLSARAIGQAGEWASLFVVPLLLSWSLMMGFFNYVLGLSLVMLATACWQLSRNVGGPWLVRYLLLLLVITFTHPVPLLLLIFILLIDVALNYGWRAHSLTPGAWVRREAIRLGVLACTIGAASFPMLAVDHNPADTAKTLAEIRFKAESVRTIVLLTGVSPYNTRSHNLWINGYRLCLYGVLLGSLWIGGRAALRALRQRQPNLGTTFFVAVVVLILALPFIPNELNGSFYFEIRLVMVVWLGALMAAGGAHAPASNTRGLIIAAALVCAAFTFIPAQTFLSPVARQLKQVESQAIPVDQHALILYGNKLPDLIRYRQQLAFNPYVWGVTLPMALADDVALDAPWMDQKISPLEPAPGSPLLLDDITATRKSRTDPPLAVGRSLPGSREADLVRKASFIVYADAPDELARGLSRQLSPEEAAKYHCSRPADWYLVCLSAGR